MADDMRKKIEKWQEPPPAKQTKVPREAFAFGHAMHIRPMPAAAVFLMCDRLQSVSLVVICCPAFSVCRPHGPTSGSKATATCPHSTLTLTLRLTPAPASPNPYAGPNPHPKSDPRPSPDPSPRALAIVITLQLTLTPSLTLIQA